MIVILRSNANRVDIALSRGEKTLASAGHCIRQHGVGCAIGISVWWNFIRIRWKIGTIFHYCIFNIRHIDASTHVRRYAAFDRRSE